MTFLAPARLSMLLVVAALAGAYVLLARRRRHYAVRFTNLDLLASVAPRRPGWRRHVPAAAMALGLVALVAGLARPAQDQLVPREEATIMLVVDVSASMDATDVEPSRFEAAVAAARQFVQDVPDRFQLGLVAFDGVARVLATPSTDRGVVLSGLDRLAPGPGTAGGEAIFAALDAIAASRPAEAGGDPEAEPGDEPEDGEEEPVAAIVLLSDGVTTVGRPVEQAAEAAADEGVPVTTIAYGTSRGIVFVEGQLIPVPVDPDTMQAVAETTGGAFFEAASGDELRGVYEDIGSRVGHRTEQREISLVFVAIGMVLLTAAAGGALLWGGRLL